MTDWQNALNLMKDYEKKNKGKNKNKNKDKHEIQNIEEFSVSLRCWECGMQIDNLRSDKYCTRCLIIYLRKLSGVPHE